MIEQPLNERQSIETIQKMIEISKNKMIDDGKHFILWGILVFICSLLHYAALEWLSLGERSGMVWIGMFVGIPISIYFGSKKESVSTILTEIYKQIWTGFGVTLGLIIYLISSEGNAPMAPLLALIGFAVFISYNFLNYKPFLYSSIFFWVCALVYQVKLSGASPSYQILFYGIVVFIGYLIPGSMLYQKHKRIMHV